MKPNIPGSTNPKRTIANEAGFTLIEVLVTLSVTSLIVMMIAGTFSQFRNLNRIRADISEKTEIETLKNYLTKRLSNALHLPLLKNNPTRKLMFIGTHSNMTFVSETKRGNVGYGLFDVEIKWDAGTQKLFEVHTPRRNNSNIASTIVSTKLRSEVSDLELSYKPFDLDEWQTSWQKPNQLPSAIRLHGTLKFDDRSHAFNLIVNVQ